MSKVYWSDINKGTWNDESEKLTYVFIPNKWWSIQAWIVAHRFGKEVQLFFMKKL